MRLSFPEFFWSYEAEAAQSVGLATLAQFFQARKFVWTSGDDDFAADFVRDVMFTTELDHGCRSGNAQARLERAGLVVNAGVDDTAVVAALVARYGVFFFEE
jgi:hypothetical protein